MTIILNANGLELNGQTIPVYSGTVHYWRLERNKWGVILDQAKALGFNMVETYIPWSVHETSPGQFDWGQVDDRKDIEAFMQACEERSLWLLVRPGPLINAELTDFGFPEWVLMDPAVQARTAQDTIHYDAAHGLHPPHQFPVPSYASDAFYNYVSGWLDAICLVMARHQAPQGCIVAVQSDNETCYMFHDQAYATDYSVDSIKLYHRHLKEKYENIEALNTAYSHTYADFDSVEAPRDCEVQSRTDIPRHVDWVEYKEYQIRWCVAKLARMMRERGITHVPIFHDVAYQYRTPLDIPAMEADPDIDWVGMNLYANEDDYAGVSTRLRFLSGTTRLPFVPEFGCGLWSHHPRTFTPREHEFVMLSALLNGLKAFNLYMLAERDRWQGCPITRHGTLREDRAPFYRQLTTMLHHYRFWEFTKQRDTIVLFNYDAGRYAALASTLHFAHADLLGLPRELSELKLDLGFSHDPRLEADPRPGGWLHTTLQWLMKHHVHYDLGDTHLKAEQLQKYKLVCLPTVDFLDACSQQELIKYVNNGGHLVIGPVMPSLTPALTPHRALAEHVAAPGTTSIGKGQLTWVDINTLPATLTEVVPPPPFDCDQPSVDLALHCRPDLSLLFAANTSSQPVTTTLAFTGDRTFTPAWPGVPALQGAASATVTIPAYSVYIWELAHD